MTEPQIIVSIFKKVTHDEFMRSPRTHLGNKNKLHCYHPGDIVLLTDIESKQLFAITTLDAYEDGHICREHHILDEDIYSGEKTNYNRYEVKIKPLVEVSVPFESLAVLCGKSPTDMTNNNIWRPSQFNFRRAFYKGDDEVVVRLRHLVNSLLSVKRN
jgi:hypothetical protein